VPGVRTDRLVAPLLTALLLGGAVACDDDEADPSQARDVPTPWARLATAARSSSASANADHAGAADASGVDDSGPDASRAFGPLPPFAADDRVTTPVNQPAQAPSATQRARRTLVRTLNTDLAWALDRAASP